MIRNEGAPLPERKIFRIRRKPRGQKDSPRGEGSKKGAAVKNISSKQDKLIRDILHEAPGLLGQDD